MKGTATTVVLKHCIPCNITQTKLQSEQIGYFKGYCNQKGQCCQVAGRKACFTAAQITRTTTQATSILQSFRHVWFYLSQPTFCLHCHKTVFSLFPSLYTYIGTHTHRLSHISICKHTHNSTYPSTLTLLIKVSIKQSLFQHFFQMSYVPSLRSVTTGKNYVHRFINH